MCGFLDDMKALMKVNNICVMKQQLKPAIYTLIL